jgi:hypothetical protein
MDLSHPSCPSGLQHLPEVSWLASVVPALIKMGKINNKARQESPSEISSLVLGVVLPSNSLDQGSSTSSDRAELWAALTSFCVQFSMGLSMTRN